MNNESDFPCVRHETYFQAWAGLLPSSCPAAFPHSHRRVHQSLSLALLRLSLLFVLKGQREERGRGNELSEMGKGRGYGGSAQKEKKMISLVCLVQSLKAVLKMKLEGSSKLG